MKGKGKLKFLGCNAKWILCDAQNSQIKQQTMFKGL